MAQTIEAFVGNALDEAKISPLHRRVVALIAAGYFCDVIDFTILGALIPFIIKSGFTTPGEAAIIGSSAIFGMAIGTAGQGEFSDRFGRRFIYQFNLLLFGIFTILGALAPSVTLLVVCRFIAGHRPRRRAAARLRLCRRIFAQGDPRPHSRHRPFHRRRLRVADRNGTGARRSVNVRRHARIRVARRVDRHRRLALIVWVFRFTLPESPRFLATHGRGHGSAESSRTPRH